MELESRDTNLMPVTYIVLKENMNLFIVLYHKLAYVIIFATFKSLQKIITTKRESSLEALRNLLLFNFFFSFSNIISKIYSIYYLNYLPSYHTIRVYVMKGSKDIPYYLSNLVTYK